jgi:hypothetical protein
MNGIVLNSELNFVVNNGSLFINDNRYGRAKILISSHKGEIKMSPMVGFGASLWLKRALTADIRQSFLEGIEMELKSDGMSANATLNEGMNLDDVVITVN